MFSAEAVELGEVLFMAVPYTAINDTIQSAGAANFKGKVVVDVTNPLTGQLNLDAGFKTSGAEQLVKIIPDSKVVKVFNYAFANNMSTGRIKGERLTLFVAGDYKRLEQKATELAMWMKCEKFIFTPLRDNFVHKYCFLGEASCCTKNPLWSIAPKGLRPEVESASFHSPKKGKD